MSENNPIISIIIPIYKGKQYISQLIDQVNANATVIPDYNVEVVLYNDYPEERIEKIFGAFSSNLSVKVINGDDNLGIHGARIAGLKGSTGEIIMFLDQDDYIYPNYLKSQLAVLGDGDISVCKVIHNGKCHYSPSFKFEDVVTPDFIMNRWNPIVSPGQVLIRRRAIPKLWINKILKTNGADDYFLWLLLAKNGTIFKLNDEILFEHTVNGDNTSLDTNRMMDSEAEMIKYLLESGLFSKEDEKELINLQMSLRRIHIKELEDYRESFLCYKTLYDGLSSELNDKKIGIYGAGIIGRTLGHILISHYNVDAVYIDRNAGNIDIEGKAYTPENVPDDLDIVVVTPLPGREKIISDIKGIFNCKICSLNEFLQMRNTND